MLKRKINLIYWNNPNYGDCLSPYIINKLTDRQVLYKEKYRGFKGCIKQIIYLIKHKRYKEIRYVHLPIENTLIAIGSIISFSTNKSNIWGTGFISNKDPFYGGKVYAVRGKFTRNRLLKMKVDCPEVYGDPALLLPLVFPLNLEKKHISIIPHYVDYDDLYFEFSDRFKIIKLESKDVENITKEIASSSFVLSSSLHGIIVAHAYGVPAIWIKNKETASDGIKFKDYFSSVSIPLYEGFDKLDIILKDKDSVINFFRENELISKPNINLKELQKKLILNAPFKISDKIINKITPKNKI